MHLNVQNVKKQRAETRNSAWIAGSHSTFRARIAEIAGGLCSIINFAQHAEIT